MSADPPPPYAGQAPEEPPRGPRSRSMVVGIVGGIAAVLGVWTLLIAGICTALAGRIGG